jgi:hypothetical protein
VIARATATAPRATPTTADLRFGVIGKRGPAEAINTNKSIKLMKSHAMLVFLVTGGTTGIVKFNVTIELSDQNRNEGMSNGGRIGREITSAFRNAARAASKAGGRLK